MTLQRERALTLALLLMLAAAAWGVLIWQSATTNEMGMGRTMGMGGVVFMTIWVVMMVAMMFPTAAPMILAYTRVQRDRQNSERALAPIWVFTGAYLLIWTLLARWRMSACWQPRDWLNKFPG